VHLQIGRCISKLAVPNVNQEAKFAEKVGSQNWLLNVGNYKGPTEGTAKTKIHGE
jgi:hypothetical protein